LYILNLISGVEKLQSLDGIPRLWDRKGKRITQVNQMNRIAILIDGNNFYKGCQLNFNRTDVDFSKLGQKLCRAVDGELLRVYYYNAHVSKTIDPLGYQRQQKFFDNLRATPFITLKLGHLVYHRVRNNQAFSSQFFPTEKGIDVQIAVDMIRLGLLKSCEGVILVSGDSDYIYAVRFAKDLGCNIFVASFPQGGSNELRNEGDGFIMMDEQFIQGCFIRTTPYTRREPFTSPERPTVAVEARDVRPELYDFEGDIEPLQPGETTGTTGGDVTEQTDEGVSDRGEEEPTDAEEK